MGLTNYVTPFKYRIYMHYVLIMCCLLLSLTLSALIIPRILVVAYRKKLFDFPDSRKVHQVAVPRLGGFSFLPAVLFSFLFFIAFRYLIGMELNTSSLIFIVPEILFLICGLILLYLAGIKDDLVGLRYRSKFVVQVVAVGMLPFSGLWINNLYGLFGIHELMPFIGIPFTILVSVFIINSINLIDGIDGLASGLSALSLFILGFLFSYHSLWIYAMLSFASLGSIIPFFLYNVYGKAENCKKIFMGDTGSMTLGYLLAFLAIRSSSCHPELISCSNKAFIIAFSTLLIPIFDTFRVMLVRARNHKHIFTADKSHIHHKLLAIGFTPRRTLCILLFLSLFFCGMNAILVSVLNINLLLLIDIGVYTGLSLWIGQVRGMGSTHQKDLLNNIQI